MREVGTSLVSVGVQSLQIVIRSELVREVLGARSWIPIPGARNEVPGVVIWGGRALSMIDLARFESGLQQLAPGDQRARMLIVATSNVTIAIPADQVSEVWKTHDDNIRPRQLHGFALARDEAVVDDQAFPLFDPEILLSRLGVET